MLISNPFAFVLTGILEIYVLITGNVNVDGSVEHRNVLIDLQNLQTF